MSITQNIGICGKMFSGKTTKLLEIMEAFDSQNIKYIAVKPHITSVLGAVSAPGLYVYKN